MKKLLITMKMLTFFLFAACLSASASGTAQSVTLSGKNLTIKMIFTAIEKQTGYAVGYHRELFARNKTISLSVNKLPLHEFLDMVLKDQPVEYGIAGKTIFIFRKSPVVPEVLSPVVSSDQSTPPLRVRVLDSLGQPLSGATVTVKNSKVSGVTDGQGGFSLNVNEGDVLLVSYVGHETRSVIVTPSMLSSANEAVITLRPSVGKLEDVEVIVNTGYQQLPKERATGSFVFIDNKTLNRTAGPDIVARLEGMVPGLLFNRTGASGEDNGTYELEARGRATIMSETQPLIILDNFPYEGRIEDLNPNDIESITVLKDAAAASIWGARAGNGVIVITSKQGQYNRKINVGISHNSSITDRPDLFYDRHYNTSERVMTIEKEKFDAGHYDGSYDNNSHYIASPYADLLLKLRANEISQADFDEKERRMLHTDVRHDLLKYFYQPAVYSQTNLSINGGSRTHRFFLSAAFDRNKGKLVRDKDRKVSINLQNSYKPKENLEIGVRMFFTERNAENNGFNITGLGGLRMGLVPYSDLVNDDGTPAAIANTIRDKFVDLYEIPNQLRWDYRPFEELQLRDKTAQSNQWSITAFTNYEPIKGISLSANYAVAKSTYASEEYFSKETFYVRDLVNQFTQADGTRIVPYEGILRIDPSKEQIQHSGRVQLNANKKFGKHDIAALAGGEIRQTVNESLMGKIMYGHNKELGIGNVGMDFSKKYPKYRSGTQWIPRESGGSDPYLIDRNLSYYGNFSYAYLSRYILSGSMRWDGANIFGVKTNQKGVPLWSAGLSWDVLKEGFLQSDRINVLRLRATYGKAGNVNNSVTSMMVTGKGNSGNLPNRGPYGYVSTPGNPSLRWETVNTFNFGIDFALFNNRLSGGVEHFRKDAHDLIGDAHIPPSTGINKTFRVKAYRYNYASLRSTGWDLHLQSKNLTGSLKWNTNYIFSVASDKVRAYYNTPVTNITTFIRTPPYEVGEPVNRLFALPWHGLDNEGKVIAYDADGNKTTNYIAAYQSFTVDDLVYAGRTSAPVYGSVLNYISWKGVEISFLITWKGKYYFRRQSIFPGQEYGTKLSNILTFHDDLTRKWEQPGDELKTNVPKGGNVNSFDASEAIFYLDSEALISRGDHIAFQNINLNYTLPISWAHKIGASYLNVYGVANNLGLIWKADKSTVDPNTPSARYPQSKVWTIGIRCNF